VAVVEDAVDGWNAAGTHSLGVREWVTQVPEEIDAMIDGRVDWDGASQGSQFAEFLMEAPEADEVVPRFQLLLRGVSVPVNGADAVAGHTGFWVWSSIPTSRLVRPIANWLLSCLALPPQDWRRG
jgi:hypothetical protein